MNFNMTTTYCYVRFRCSRIIPYSNRSICYIQIQIPICNIDFTITATYSIAFS